MALLDLQGMELSAEADRGKRGSHSYGCGGGSLLSLLLC